MKSENPFDTMSQPLQPLFKKFLKAKAHHLKPVNQIGKNGVNSMVLQSIHQALKDHELIKVKFIDFKEEKNELCQKIASELDATFVSMTGNVALFFKENIQKNEKSLTVQYSQQ